MAPRKSKGEGICLVMDLGPSSRGSGYLEKALKTAMSLVERKLFRESEDLFGLVLFGGDWSEEKNPLGYPGVSLLEEFWGKASFDLLHLLETKVMDESSGEGADWLDAIVVALNFLKEKAPDSDKKILLFSDLSHPSKDEDLEIIISNMEKENVELSFFGPDWEEPDSQRQGTSTDEPPPSKPKTPSQLAGEAVLNEIVQRTDGIMCSADEALANLLYKERKSKKPFPWKVVLQLGPDIKISTAGYIAVRREPPKSWKKCLTRPTNDSSYEIKRAVTYSREGVEDTIERSDLIESFKYGSKLITVSDEDKANAEYDGGSKSLIVIGFIQIDQIPHQYCMGDGSMVFLPADEDEHSATALSALTFGMIELGRAALVRKVYRAKSSPRLGILVPEHVEDEYRLVFIELPFAEDVRRFGFNPLYTESTMPSNDQLDAMDRYIEAASLEADEFETEAIPNPCHQFLYRCLAHRASHPGRILPNVDDFIKNLYRAPKRISDDTKNIIGEMLSLFPLESIEPKKGRKRKSDLNEQTEDITKEPKRDESTEPIDSISVETPVIDFNKLLDQGEQLGRAIQLLEEVIFKLLSSELSDHSSVLVSCMKAYRETCLIKSSPGLFNEFLRKFKNQLRQLENDIVWLEIAEKGLGLITKFEHGKSNVSTKEADNFLTSI